MASRLLASLLLASLAACGGDDTPPDGPDAAVPGGDPAIGTCHDFIAAGAFGTDEAGLWRVEDGVPSRLLDGVPIFALSPDRTRVAIARPFAVHVIDVDTGDRTIVPVDGEPDRLHWSTKDPLAIVGGDVWTIDPVAALARPVLEGAWTDARWSPDGKVLAAVAPSGLWLRYPNSSDPVNVIGNVHQLLGWNTSFAVTAASNDGEVWQHIEGTGAVKVTTLRAATDLLLSPDGTTLAYVSANLEAPTARFLSIGDVPSSARVLTTAAAIDLLSWASDGAVLYTTRSNDGASVLWFGGQPRTAPITTGTWYAVQLLGACTAGPPVGL